MQALNDKITVLVSPDQKTSIEIGGIMLSTALEFETNYREKSPTIATVIEGNDVLGEGDVILCHHNLFYLPSPHYIGGNLYSIKANSTLFTKILPNGDLVPIYGNLICNRIEKFTLYPIPVEERETYNCVYDVVIGNEKFKSGTRIVTRPSSGYDIVYDFDTTQRRITKVNEEMICGIIT